jgi:tetratricopeptide (TPR) repeat protein
LRTRRRFLACWAALAGLALLLSACGEKPSPQELLQQADARLAAGDAAGAQGLLREALNQTPSDVRLRIALARADLAMGNLAAAEGSLERAMQLGAPKGDVVGDLARVLLAKGEPQRVIDLVGDVSQWPQSRRLMPALSKAEAALALPRYNRRDLTKSFVEVFRLRASAQADSAQVDLAWFDRHTAELRRKDAAVEGGFQHFACNRAPEATENAPSPDAPIPPAGRRVLQVGPERQLRRPSDAARVAQDNDLIEIDAGRYVGDVALWMQNGLLLRGVNGRPHLDSQGRVAQEQGIWVFRGNDIAVENIEFSGARSPHRNGSGIRFLGRNLTVRDSYFHDNEDGVLSYNTPDSDILIERSVFAHNGAGDGQSHNMYIGGGRRFTLRFSHSHDSITGHEVKSRARFNFIEYNRLTDEDDGTSSYLIDVPDGGYAYVVGNVLEKGGRTENPNAIAFASEKRDLHEGGLWVVNNTYYNRRVDSTFVANRSKRPAFVVNNVLAGAPAVLLDGPGTDRNNFRQPQSGMVDPAAYDFRPTAESPLIDSGEDPGTADSVTLWPQFEYVHPAAGRARRKVAALDLGAYEFCGS